MSPPVSDILAQWLERLHAQDLGALAQLYAPDAVVRAASEQWCGREEIEDGLTSAQRLLRKFAVERVESTEDESGLTFQTWIRGRLGHAVVRHHWTLEGGHILGHEMELLKEGVAVGS